MNKFLATIIAVTLSTSAMADTPKVSDAFMTEAMAFVTTKESLNIISPYAAKQVVRGEISLDDMPVPTIIYVSQEQMIKIISNGEPARAGSILNDTIAQFDYDPESPTYTSIYLLNTWDESDIFNREILVHELVHAVQEYIKMFKVVRCIKALESPAYTISMNYLIANGVTDTDVIETHILQALLYSMCSPAGRTMKKLSDL